MMDTLRHLFLSCSLLIFGLAACEGGSGSSGFDVRSENAAIQEALVGQHCVQHESLTICPAAETGATPSPTPPPTATSGVQQVEIDIDPRAPVLCVSVQDGGCAFVLPFAVSGFPPTETFRVAVRTVDPNGRWMISDVLTPSGPATPTFEAPVDLGAPVSLCCGTAVQAAILAFFNPPASVPATVDELVDTGADKAFVTEPFTVQAD
jgi:hypothetical protein